MIIVSGLLFKKYRNAFYCILFLIMATICLPAYSFNKYPCTSTGLRCEYLVNPLGIDAPSPRLTWRMADDRAGARQTASQIIVGTDSAEVAVGKANKWNSGKILSGVCLVNYRGESLQSFTKYFWRVIIWDKDNKISNNGEIATFETGMMNSRNWKGSWISDVDNINLKPAPYFRKSFSISKSIKSARAYIAVAGLYELYINGNKVGDHCLDPAFTRFDRRTLYITYDITSQLQNGGNAIGVLLGNGWYNLQSTAVWDIHKATWRARPAFCMDMRIIYTDGSEETIVSGKDWKTSLSPVVFNSIYTAEHYDARLEQPGWNNTDFDDSKWKNVIYRAAPSLNIVSQVLHPIRKVEDIASNSINKISDTDYVFDLGRNIAGVSEIKVKGLAGDTIRLKHAERLYKDGHVDLSNIDIHYRPTDNTDPFQTDIYILSGKGEETFTPHFNYKGFQYVEVTSSRPILLTRESLHAYFMHSDVPVAGDIKSSDIIIDKIWSATNHSYLSNLFGYPTDCPQREKNGWTGDAHIAIETGLYNFDGITIYEKWMADHRDEQQNNGVLPSIIPSMGWGYEWGNGPDWTSTIAIIPWNIYLFYGDKKLLSDCYENIKLYVNHIMENSPSGLTTWGLGDWVPVKSVTPVEFTSSAYYYADASILAKAANLLDRKEDYIKYSALAEKIKNAINAKYLNKETGIYGTGFQTELSVPLFWGIVPGPLKDKVAANLAKRVETDNFHLDVGLLGSKTILNALSENGYADAAYKIASQKTFPSWGWWMVNGATTLYENWPIDAKSDISLNHIMFGEVGAWFYKALGGIKPDPELPGFKNVLLEPHFVTGLDHFETSHMGPYGMIRSDWKRTDNKILYSVIIPANSSATMRLHIPTGRKLYESGKPVEIVLQSDKPANIEGELLVYKVQAGTHSFEIR